MTVQCKTKPFYDVQTSSSQYEWQVLRKSTVDIWGRGTSDPTWASEGRPDWNSGGYENLTEHKQSPNTPPTHRECHPQNKTSREACVNHTHTLSCSIWRPSQRIIKARAQVEWNQAWAELEMSLWEGFRSYLSTFIQHTQHEISVTYFNLKYRWSDIISCVQQSKET